MVVQIPADGLFYALFKLEGRLPAQFLLELGGVDGVTEVVACTVRYVGDEVHILAFLAAQQTVHRIDEHFDDVNVLPLIEPADVVSLRHFPLMEDEVDGAGMILHVQPVAHILAFSVHRQRFAVADVVDEQRDQLLRELVRAVVVGAVGHDGGHAKRIVEGPHKMVARSLSGRVRRMRLVLEVFREELGAVGQVVRTGRSLGGKRRLNALRVGHLQSTVHLVGADVVETAGNRRSRVGARDEVLVLFPARLGGLEERKRTHHVGLSEGERILDGTVHVRLGRQVDDAVHVLLLHELEDTLEVADIHHHKAVIGLVLNVLEVGQIARISELIQVNDLILRVFIHKEPDHVAADEPRAAGDKDGSFHEIWVSDGTIL